MDKFITKKRVRIKRQICHPNPLFEKWLKEWKLDAENRGSKMKYNFQKAIKSLQKFPLPLQSGKDCQVLAHFGSKICDMIDKKLEECGGKESQPIIFEKHNAVGLRKRVEINSSPNKKIKQNATQYIPSPKSGAYALLIALHKESNGEDEMFYMKKQELIEAAQEYCDASFTVPMEGSHYTAWSSMSILIRKMLVQKNGSPARYYLTPEGKSLSALLLSSDSIPTPGSQRENYSDSGSRIKAKTGIQIFESFIKDKDLISFKEDTYGGEQEYDKDLERQRKRIKISEDTDDAFTFLQDDLVKSSSSENIIFTLRPGTFKVILNVDNSEVFGGSFGGKKSTKEILTKELEKNGITFKVRKLNVGDFLWTCQGTDTNGEVKEVALPLVVERKRMDDLGQSIRDGRFKEQKFRLKQSGLSRPIYLVEEYGSSHSIVPLSTCEQAIINTQVIDNFTVRVTKDQKESAAYLTIMTRYLENKFKRKTLHCVPRNSLSFAKDDLSSPTLYLLDFKELNSFVAKNRPMCLQEMFAKHLLQINGASVDKVSAIVQKYKTPHALIKALEDKYLSYKENLLCNLKCPKSGRTIDQTISAQVARLYTSQTLL